MHLRKKKEATIWIIKLFLPRKAQRPSKQTNEKIAIKIIRSANKIKNKYKKITTMQLPKSAQFELKELNYVLKKQLLVAEIFLTKNSLEKLTQNIIMTLKLEDLMSIKQK